MDLVGWRWLSEESLVLNTFQAAKRAVWSLGTSEKSPPFPDLAFESSCSAREPGACRSAIPVFSEVSLPLCNEEE